MRCATVLISLGCAAILSPARVVAELEPSLLAAQEVVLRQSIDTEDGPRTFVANEALFDPGGANFDKIFAHRPLATTLWSRERRLKCYAHALKVAAQLAALEGGATSDRMLDEILPQVGGALQASDALASLHQLRTGYVPAEFALDRLRNDLSSVLRAINPRSIQGAPVRMTNLEKLSQGLLLVDWGTTIAGYAYAAGLDQALAGDAALGRLEAMDDALRQAQAAGAPVDPLWFDAIEEARESLTRDETYFGALMRTLEDQKGEIAARGLTTAYSLVIGRFHESLAMYMKAFLEHSSYSSNWGSARIAAHASHAGSLWTVSLLATYLTIDGLLDQHERAQCSVAASTLDYLLHEGAARGASAGAELNWVVLQNQMTYFHKMEAASSGFLVGLHDFIARLVGGSRYADAADYFAERKEDRQRRLREVFAAGPRSPQVTGDCTAGQDVALILDSSGSMSQSDPQGLRREAAGLFLDRVAADVRIAAVDFDSDARVATALGTDREAVRRMLRAVDADGGTNITRALSVGLDVLRGGPGTRAALLFTDGQSNEQEGAAAFVTEGIPVHVVGLGAAVNAEFLTRLASETGGIYLQAGQAQDLMGAFDQIIADLSCEGTVFSRRARLLPGQSAEYRVGIDAGLSWFTCRLTWGGSRFELAVLDPSGAQAGAAAGSGATYAMARVDPARSGTWTVRVTAADVPAQGEDFLLRVGGPSELRVAMAARADDPTVLRMFLNAPDRSFTPSRAWSRVVSPDGAEIDGPEPRPAADGSYEVFVPVGDAGVYGVTAGLGGGSGASEWSREVTRTIVVGEGAIAWRGVVTRIEGAYARFNRGMRHGMRPGLEVSIGPPGQPAGRGHILSCLDAECTVEIEQLFGGAMCREGMAAEVDVRQWMGDATP